MLKSKFHALMQKVYDQKGASRPTMRSALRWLASHDFEVNTVLDVGASDGRWSLQCMDFYPAANYVLFDPNPMHDAALKAFEATVKPSTHIIQKAVGHDSGSVHFNATDPFGGAMEEQQTSRSIEPRRR